jgi:Leucine-rich repeat (LRR) protein
MANPCLRLNTILINNNFLQINYSDSTTITPIQKNALISVLKGIKYNGTNEYNEYIKKCNFKGWCGSAEIDECGQVVYIGANTAGSGSPSITIPPIISNLYNLYGLSLSSYNLTVPKEIWKLYNLTDLYLANINIPISSDIQNLKKLRSLDLSITVKSEIPNEIGYLTNLEYLSLDDCNLYGYIPPTIGNLNNLTKLNLAQNCLSITKYTANAIKNLNVYKTNNIILDVNCIIKGQFELKGINTTNCESMFFAKCNNCIGTNAYNYCKSLV